MDMDQSSPNDAVLKHREEVLLDGMVLGKATSTNEDKPRLACYAYPCKAQSGIQAVDCVKSHYYYAKDDLKRLWSEERLHFILPGLKGNILDMNWKDVEAYTLKQYPGNSAEDKTMMKKDFDTLTESQYSIDKYSVSTSYYIDEEIDTHVQDMKVFLTCGPRKEEEVKVLCLIGHGLSQSTAKSLNQEKNLPEFDGENCKDTSRRESKFCRRSKVYSTMKSKVWKWQLDNCSGEERDGLGEGYTARSVCQNAKKGDIVAFAAGFITPEWLVEQLHKREENEKNSPNGITFYTLVLLVDACFSGRWIDRIKDNPRTKELQNTRLIIQTACDSNEVSYGDYFIPLWYELQQNGSTASAGGESEDEIELECLQTPQFFDSCESAGDVQAATGLKFFKNGEHFTCFKRGFCRLVTMQEYYDIISHFDQATIESYTLKSMTKNGTPMALILVTYEHCMYQLHIHFQNNELSGVNIVSVKEVEKTEKSKYLYKEIKGTKKKNLQRNVNTQNVLARCQAHVHDHEHLCDVDDCRPNWDDKGTWKMKHSEPPGMIRSRTATLELNLRIPPN